MTFYFNIYIYKQMKKKIRKRYKKEKSYKEKHTNYIVNDNTFYIYNFSNFI